MTECEPPVFLKLGGALLTRKDGREAVRTDVLARLAAEVAAWRTAAAPPLVLAHGSGSFAHVAVRETGLLRRPGDALAGARVAAAARRLSGVVVDALIARGLPAVAVPGSLLATCDDGQVDAVRPALVADLLAAGLLPVVYGDVAPDGVRGLAIASTEPLLAALAAALCPTRIVLATDVDGVYPADPHADPAGPPLPVLSAVDARRMATKLRGARFGASDVTGGMATKVGIMLDLLATMPEVEVRIVSGLRPGAVAAALAGSATAGGTRLVANSRGV